MLKYGAKRGTVYGGVFYDLRWPWIRGNRGRNRSTNSPTHIQHLESNGHPIKTKGYIHTSKHGRTRDEGRSNKAARKRARQAAQVEITECMDLLYEEVKPTPDKVLWETSTFHGVRYKPVRTVTGFEFDDAGEDEAPEWQVALFRSVQKNCEICELDRKWRDIFDAYEERDFDDDSYFLPKRWQQAWGTQDDYADDSEYEMVEDVSPSDPYWVLLWLKGEVDSPYEFNYRDYDSWADEDDWDFNYEGWLREQEEANRWGSIPNQAAEEHNMDKHRAGERYYKANKRTKLQPVQHVDHKAKRVSYAP